MGVSKANVDLTWDANPETDLAGYKVYWGVKPRVYGTPTVISKETTHRLVGFATGTYYFAVTAYNTAGLESGYSNEVSMTVLPAPPTLNISSCTPPCISSLTVADITTTSVAISWATNPECSGTIFWGTTSELGKIVVANNLATTDHWARVYGLTTRTHYFFKVSSVCGGTTVTSDLRSFNTK